MTTETPKLDTERIKRIRDFLRVNAPKELLRNRLGRLGMTLLIIALLGGGYFFIFVSNERVRFDQERFRALAQRGQNIEALISEYQEVVQRSGTSQQWLRRSLGLRLDLPAGITLDERSNHMAFRPYKDNTIPYYLNLDTLFSAIPQDERFSDFLLTTSDKILYQSLPFRVDVSNYFTRSPQDSIGLWSPFLRKVELAGVSYRAYIDQLGFVGMDSTKLYLVGLVMQDQYRAETNRTNPLIVVMLAMVVVLVLISFPLLKFWLINELEPFRRRDSIMASVSVVLGVPLMVVLLLSTWEHTEYRFGEAYRDLRDVRGAIAEAFLEEVATMRQMLVRFDEGVGIDAEVEAFLRGDTQARARQMMDDALGVDYPMFNEMLWMDEEGLRQKMLTSYNFVDPGSLPSVKRREYFQAIVEDKAWQADSLGTLYLQSIISWATGQKEAVLSIPSHRTVDGKKMQAAAISSSMASVFDVVMPSDLDFAIVDGTGEVLFHSQMERNHAENLLVETQQEQGVQQLLQTSIRMDPQRARYRGHPVYMTGQRLGGLPLYVVVYQRVGGSYDFLANIVGITISVLTISLFLALVLGLATIWLNRSIARFTPLKYTGFAWFRPQPRFERAYGVMFWYLVGAVVFLGLLVALARRLQWDVDADLVCIILLAPTLVHVFHYRVLQLNPGWDGIKITLPAAIRNFRWIGIGWLLVLGMVQHFPHPKTGKWTEGFGSLLAAIGNYPSLKCTLLLVLVVYLWLFIRMGRVSRRVHSFMLHTAFLLLTVVGLGEELKPDYIYFFLAIILAFGESWFWVKESTLLPRLRRFFGEKNPSPSGLPRFLQKYQAMVSMSLLVAFVLPACVVFTQIEALQEKYYGMREQLQVAQRLVSRQRTTENAMEARGQSFLERRLEMTMLNGVYPFRPSEQEEFKIAKDEQGKQQQSVSTADPIRFVATTGLPPDSTVYAKDTAQETLGLSFEIAKESLGKEGGEYREWGNDHFFKVLDLLSVVTADSRVAGFGITQGRPDHGQWKWYSNSGTLSLHFREASLPGKTSPLVLTSTLEGESITGKLDAVFFLLVVLLLVGIYLLIRYLTYQILGFKYCQVPFKRPPTVGALIEEAEKKRKPLRLLYITPPQSPLEEELQRAGFTCTHWEGFAQQRDKSKIALLGLDAIISDATARENALSLLGAMSVPDNNGHVVLVSHRYPSQILSDYAQLAGGAGQDVVRWMEVFSRFQELIYPYGTPQWQYLICDNPEETCAMFAENGFHKIGEELPSSASRHGWVLALDEVSQQVNSEPDVLAHLQESSMALHRGKVVLVATTTPAEFLETVAENEQEEWEKLLTHCTVYEVPHLPNPAIWIAEQPTLEHTEKLIAAELQSGTFLMDSQFLITQSLVPSHVASSGIEKIIPLLSSTAFSHYNNLWHSLSSKEQLILYDLADDGLANPKNTTPMLSLMAKGLVRWDYEEGRLKIMSTSFNHFISEEVAKDEGKSLLDHAARRGTWASLRWVIMLVLVAVLTFVGITEPGFFSHINSFLAILGAVVTIIPSLGSLSGGSKE